MFDLIHKQSGGLCRLTTDYFAVSSQASVMGVWAEGRLAQTTV